MRATQTPSRILTLGLLLSSPLRAQAQSAACEIDFGRWVAQHPAFAHPPPLPLDSLDAVPKQVDWPLPEAAMEAANKALAEGWEARVEMAVLIDTTGHVLFAGVLGRSLKPQSGVRTASPRKEARLRSEMPASRWRAQQLFEQAATDMMLASRFDPSKRRGQRVRVLLCVPVTFSADPSVPRPAERSASPAVVVLLDEEGRLAVEWCSREGESWSCAAGRSGGT
ncbi:MAG: hypothetical protein ACE5PT_06695 [Gemmatimonadales bacterium]